MKFSIILASRERTQLLEQLLQSIADTTADISNVEVLIGIDNDDVATQNVKQNLTERYPFAKFFSRARSEMLNEDYLNWVYRIAGTGKYIIVCNDDAAFRTPNWDKIIEEKLDNYLADKPDGIVYGYISDALIDRLGLQYCCFPLVSRKGYEALDWVMPPEVPAWSADIYIWRIYSAVNRVCDLSEVMIEHISYHSGKRERDHISHHVEAISFSRPVNVPGQEYATKLGERISAYRN